MGSGKVVPKYHSGLPTRAYQFVQQSKYEMPKRRRSKFHLLRWLCPYLRPMTFHVVFDLYPFAENCYLPSAHIVQADRNGQLSHIIQKALPNTIAAYQIQSTPVLERLFGMVESLQPKALEAKFKISKAKMPTPLAKLLADKETKTAVETHINRELSRFLSEIARHRIPLTLEAERKTLAKDVLLQLADDDLVPHLSFIKSVTGIEYRLQLGTEAMTWNIRERNVIPLTNTEPAWLVANYVLCRVPGINGNMVKPFRQKDAIQIPPEKVRLYFRQFIAKNAGRTQINAEGFAVQRTDLLLRTCLEPTEHILEKTWLLKPVFEYEGAAFHFGDRRDRITALDIPDDEQGEITVRLICRNADLETEKIDFLKTLGLLEDGRMFQVEAGSDIGSLLQFLSRHRAVLESAGFQIVAPEIEGKVLALLSGDISVRSKAAGDWFDVQGQVQIGNWSFAFHKLLPNLRRRDPFFALPDGTFFLIPEEWFARYADLAGIIQEHGDRLRIPKALFTVLQQIDPENESAGFPVIDPEQIDYQPADNLHATLRPYQLRGVKWLIGHYQHGFGACLADDMGLGKTLQTIAVLMWAKTPLSQAGAEDERNVGSTGASQMDLFTAHRESLRPLNALIILPASLVFNWEQELRKFAPSLFVCIHTGPKRLRDIRALASHDVVLTTYHTARQDLDLLGKNEWHYIILDESQQIKNRESEVSRVVRSLRGRNRISLSGTPIENSLADLWTQMEFINPDTLGSFKSFREQFLLPIERQGDATARQKLFDRVRPFFMRRTKEEVAPDLPKLTEQVFFTEMTPDQKKRYDQVKSAVRNEILSLFDDPSKRLQVLQALMRLRQLANHPVLVDKEYVGSSGKMDDVLAQWDVIRRAGHKALFFSSFEKNLQLFRRVLEQQKQPFAWLTGDTPMADRAHEVTRFQSDASVQAFLITIKSGGVGLNLTAADYVFVLDPWWNPAVEDQAIARAHRIGQTRPVTAVRFIARDTIEEKIRLLQERKRALGKDLFAAAGEEMPPLTREDVELLIG